MSPEEQLAWLALAHLLPGRGRDCLRLVEALGSAEAVMEAGGGELEALGLAPAAAARLCAAGVGEELRHCQERCAALGIGLATIACRAYPPLLREISDPPVLLYYRGREPVVVEPSVAVVGSRRATRYGLRVARAMAKEIAAYGLTVTSGMAMGIDAAAHEGALESGRSAAVMAAGLDVVYPRSNRRLCQRVAESSSVMSEYPPGVSPLPRHFPVRNRIVTGLSLATVVVEAAARKSGTLVSARLAAEQGREVLAVPGNLGSPNSEGTNGLIRDGCRPLLEAADLAAAIGPLLSAAVSLGPGREGLGQTGGLPASPKDPEKASLFAALEAEPVHVDVLVEECGFDGARVMELLTTLQIEGLAEAVGGGMFARVHEPLARRRG